MQNRQQLVALPILIACVLLLAFSPKSSADTYTFEMTKEVAESPAKKLNLGSLQANSFGAAEVVSQNAEPKWLAPEKSTMTIRLGPEALAINSKDYNRIYDFKNKKIYDINNAAKSYYVHSLYADLAFRRAELNNRLFLYDMMHKAFKGKKQSNFFDKFFSEEMFAMKLPDKGSDYEVTKVKEGKAEIYKYNNLTVSSFIPGNAPLVGDKRRQFSLFLMYVSRLHPDIREDIEKAGKIPDKLMWYLDNQPVSKERVSLLLKNVSPGDYKAAPPEGFKEEHDSRSPLFPLYARIQELGGKPSPDLKQQTLDYYNAAVEKKNYFDALLSITEYGLQTGDNLGEQMSAIRDQIRADSNCQKFMAGLSPPEVEKQSTAALAALDSIDRKSSAKSYLIDIFRANLIIAMMDNGMADIKTTHEADPVKAFLKVLMANPFIGGVYHDLGKFFDASYRQPYAWESYDLARRFYPNHPFMEEIKEKEQEISNALPQFFSGDKI